MDINNIKSIFSSIVNGYIAKPLIEKYSEEIANEILEMSSDYWFDKIEEMGYNYLLDCYCDTNNNKVYYVQIGDGDRYINNLHYLRFRDLNKFEPTRLKAVKKAYEWCSKHKDQLTKW